MAFSKKFQLLLAISWLTIITVLLVLPGSAFPSENWMSGIQLDKWVHIFLFSFLVILWVKGMWKNYPNSFHYARLSSGIAILAIIYGAGMEVVQYFFVPNRSFELNDIFADLIGSLIGYLIMMRGYIKK